jgi:hypothetical protein
MEGVDLVGGARNAVLTKEHGPVDLARSSLVGLDRVPESDKPRRHRLEDLFASKGSFQNDVGVSAVDEE